jgi:acetyl-CoA carboxylase carboxyltransferase component
MEKYERKNCYDVGDVVKLKSAEALKQLPHELYYCHIENAGKVVKVKKVIHAINNFYEFEEIEGAWADVAIVGALVA